MTSWIVILGSAAGTYALRLSMLSILAGRPVPRWIERCASVIGPAAVGAIIAGLLLIEDGRPALAVDSQLVAAALGFLAVRRTGRMTDSVLVGFPALWILTAIF